MKAFTDAGWSRERAEERWKVYKLNEGVARGVANAMTVPPRLLAPGRFCLVHTDGSLCRQGDHGRRRAQEPTKSGPVFPWEWSRCLGEPPFSATISRAKHPEAAAHVEEAQAADNRRS